MPDQNKMMFIRPKNCRSCGHGYYGVGHVVTYAQSKGFTVIDVEGNEANQGPVFDALNTHDPGSIYGFGHGSETVFTGDSEQIIFDTTNVGILEGRIIYLLSCLTANQLGPAIRDVGALGYAGFDISWTWMAEENTDGDPYEDKYAEGFYRSANKLWESIIDGRNLTDASFDSVEKYNAWIDYWLYQNNQDPYATESIKWLVHDREGLIFYPTPTCPNIPTMHYCEREGCNWFGNACHVSMNCEELTNRNDCLNNGCYWYDESCHNEPDSNHPVNLVLLLPVMLVVGIAFIAFSR